MHRLALEPSRTIHEHFSPSLQLIHVHDRVLFCFLDNRDIMAPNPLSNVPASQDSAFTVDDVTAVAKPSSSVHVDMIPSFLKVDSLFHLGADMEAILDNVEKWCETKEAFYAIRSTLLETVEEYALLPSRYTSFEVTVMQWCHVTA
jgi:hypothetical protein